MNSEHGHKGKVIKYVLKQKEHHKSGNVNLEMERDSDDNSPG